MSLHAQIRSLVAQAKTEQALRVLQQAASGTDLENEAAALAGRYHRLQQEIRSGLISQSDQNIESSRISHAILGLLESLPDGKAMPVSISADIPPPVTGSPSSKPLPGSDGSLPDRDAGNAVKPLPADGGNGPGGRSSRLFPAITGISLLAGIVVLMVLLPCPTSAQFFAFRIALAAGAGGLAAVIPGFFEFKRRRSIQAGGGLAVFALIYLLNPGSFSSGGDCGPFDFTLFLEDADGSTPLNSEGKLILRLGNDKREEAIDADGSASFKQIPAPYAGDSAAVELAAPGWQFRNGKAGVRVLLQGTSQTLVIQRDSALYCCISGSVRDGRGRFLPGVRLGIGGRFAVSDSNGRFAFVLPPALQAVRYDLVATHPGYRTWEASVYPATKQETKIVLQKE